VASENEFCKNPTSKDTITTIDSESYDSIGGHKHSLDQDTTFGALMENVDLHKLQQVIDTITIPQQPNIILQLANEQLKSEPDFKRIERIVIKDVGIASYVLKVINSPFFNIRGTVDSIQQALVMLGLKQIKNLVTEKLLGEVLKTTSTPLTRKIWDHSRKSALACSLLTSEINTPFKPKKEQAYTLGLFHRCGVLLLMRKFPSYMDIYSQALEAESPLHELELQEFGIDHRMVGYAMALAWRLNPDIALSILNHHETSPWATSAGIDAEQDVLEAILELSDTVLKEGVADPRLLAYLGLTNDTFPETEDRLLIRLNNETQGRGV